MTVYGSRHTDPGGRWLLLMLLVVVIVVSGAALVYGSGILGNGGDVEVDIHRVTPVSASAARTPTASPLIPATTIVPTSRAATTAAPKRTTARPRATKKRP